jgi:hypothetical protein
MNLIDKHQLIDDLLIIALERNNLSIKEIYELIRKQKVIEVRR